VGGTNDVKRNTPDTGTGFPLVPVVRKTHNFAAYQSEPAPTTLCMAVPLLVPTTSSPTNRSRFLSVALIRAYCLWRSRRMVELSL
jgi:hypothetical protein